MQRTFFYRLQKRILFFLAFMAFQSALIGQNLVINPSFENVNVGSLQCSWYTTIAQFNSAINNWTLPTGGSTDIFNTALATSCYCSPFSTHTSNPGQQAPRTGNGYCNIVTWGNGGCAPWREYLQGQLSSPMLVGQTYEVEMWVSLADKMSRGTNNIGVKFSTNPYTSTSNCPYYTTPDLNYLGPIILDKANWVQILFTYTPTVAGLDNFIIGNFYNDAATATQLAAGVTTGNVIRYYVDDVRIEAVVTLPIELSAYSATCMNNSVQLEWTTATEQNNDHFIIEKSTNSIDFYEIGEVNGAGTSFQNNDYRFVDNEAENRVNYYRLAQYDFDGKRTYSKIIASQCEGAVDFFPNPSSGDLFVSLFDHNAGTYFAQITDLIGHQITEQVTFSNDNETIRIQTFETLVKGVYIVQLKDSEGRIIASRKVIKQ